MKIVKIFFSEKLLCGKRLKNNQEKRKCHQKDYLCKKIIQKFVLIFVLFYQKKYKIERDNEKNFSFTLPLERKTKDEARKEQWKRRNSKSL